MLHVPRPALAALLAVLALSPALAPVAHAAPLAPGLPAVSAGPWGAWRVETVDAGNVHVLFATTLRLDREDRPHIFYEGPSSTPGGFTATWYARREGMEWVREMVEDRSAPGGMDLDTQDRPHVAYRGSLAFDMRYATRTPAGVWTIEVVDNQPARGATNDIEVAVDAQDRPHIAYRYANNLRYATRDPLTGGWHTETVDTTGWAGAWLSLALDSKGQPWIAHSTAGPDGDHTIRLVHRTTQTGAWTLQFVQGCISDLSLALDQEDRPHLSCYDQDQGLRYVWFDGAQWRNELLDQGFSRGRETSLALDSQGRPHITYVNYGDSFALNPTAWDKFMYTTRTPAGVWVKDQVDLLGQYNGAMSSLQLDRADRPHVSYVYGWTKFGEPEGPLYPRADLRYAEPVVAAGPGVTRP